MFPKGFHKKTVKNLFFQQEEPQQVFLTLDSVSGVRLSSQLVPGKRESAECWQGAPLWADGRCLWSSTEIQSITTT